MSECKHTKCPAGYLQWHPWAEKMSKTHTQIKCKNCGLYAIWIKTNPTPSKETK